ncbi:MAG: PilZ domain-containing protein [Thermodesulfovibrionia bacterium]|nr:PilZ domain-containing protein [Thermodesulfovibrionia bacterium]
MTGNSTDLILNLARNAPWLIAGGNNVFPEVIRGDSHEILSEIKNNRLTIITERGQVYELYQSLAIINGKIQIDKPFGWRDGSPESFHVFFRNRHGNWNYFPAEDVVYYPSVLQIKAPAKVYYLEKRGYHRVKTPIGTKVIFKGHNNHRDGAHVKDISEGGMLIFHNSGKSKYPVDSIINEILITTPLDRTTAGRRIVPLISKGEVVRTFYDHKQGISYCGVKFFHKSAYVQEKIRDLVTFSESLSA